MATPPVAPSQTRLVQGFLTKRGLKLKTWKLRYFVLFDNRVLCYYKLKDFPTANARLPEPLGTIDLARPFRLLLGAAIPPVEWPSNASVEAVFGLETAERIFYLVSTREDYPTWAAALHQVQLVSSAEHFIASDTPLVPDENSDATRITSSAEPLNSLDHSSKPEEADALADHPYLPPNDDGTVPVMPIYSQVDKTRKAASPELSLHEAQQELQALDLRTRPAPPAEDAPARRRPAAYENIDVGRDINFPPAGAPALILEPVGDRAAVARVNYTEVTFDKNQVESNKLRDPPTARTVYSQIDFDKTMQPARPPAYESMGGPN
ncbi:uncharacterized protein MONBRDRAFT_23409 [Monosiga brevicollis MX1]|uniref:PH domain-containing protein n=1 Tax=Monosiga brevicollis TaxID=81824 RepID=A9UTB3_MONBE|nr:uncharacterized protein MONBRDRAFT_23409 [Monosiga brevicollis MX1]EDQ91216.1 predicted protein [Monosiga brevicollis MX1]|eukprot:XP_001743638.1 hypothetical protein [Monosiga brevicollis MX1]